MLRFLGDLAAENLISAAEGSAPLLAPSDDDGAAEFPAPRLERYTDMQDLLLLDPIHDVDERGWPNAVDAGTQTGP